MELATIRLQHPIEVGGAPKSVLHVRHALRMGDLAAVQRYARRHRLDADLSSLLGDGDLGALAALAESLCDLPPGSLDQMHPDDLSALVEGISPFCGTASPATGATPSASSPSSGDGARPTSSPSR